MRYEVNIEANLVSKKNVYKQTKSGRRFKPQSVVDAEKDAISQIPADIWGLELHSPHMVFWFQLPSKSFALDRDGVSTTILDFFTKAKVIKDDNTRHCNGLMLFTPAIKADKKRFKVWIYPGETPVTTVFKDIENELR